MKESILKEIAKNDTWWGILVKSDNVRTHNYILQRVFDC